MSEQEIKNIIFDLYMVMKFKGYKKLTIGTTYASIEADISEVNLPARAEHIFKQKKVKTVEDAIWIVKDDERARRIRGFGDASIADTKHAILMWHINNNVINKRNPLWGIELSVG